MGVRKALSSFFAMIMLLINIYGIGTISLKFNPEHSKDTKSSSGFGHVEVYEFADIFDKTDAIEYDVVATRNDRPMSSAANINFPHATSLQTVDAGDGSESNGHQSFSGQKDNSLENRNGNWFTDLLIRYTSFRYYELRRVKQEQKYAVKTEYTLEHGPSQEISYDKNQHFPEGKSNNNDVPSELDINEQSPHEEDKQTRAKRRAQTHTIELFFVVDYAAYQWWKTLSVDFEIHVLDLIREYYAYIFRGLNFRFQDIETHSYHIDAVLKGIQVATSENDSYWTLTSTLEINESNPRIMVNSSEALEKFQEWLDFNDTDLPQFDHAILFTGTNLSYAGNTGNTGLAFGSSMCLNISNSSIVEDSYDFRTITYASQQLARSLGSNDDMDNNDCLEFFSYIMAPKFKIPIRSFASNRWKFSACSQQYLKDYLTSLDDLGLNCLENVPNDDRYPSDFSNIVKDEPLGFVYNAKRQCQIRFGYLSDVCRMQIRSAYSELCTGLLCTIPNTDSCGYLLPADGTTCGNKKYCWHGNCQEFEDASVASDTCAFGNEPGLECDDTVQNKEAACYEDTVQYRCCQTCESIAQDVPGCEFGDRVDNCSVGECNNGDEIYTNRNCCQTCAVVQSTKKVPDKTTDHLTQDISSPSPLTIGSMSSTTGYTYLNSRYSTPAALPMRTVSNIELNTFPQIQHIADTSTLNSQQALNTHAPTVTKTDQIDHNAAITPANAQADSRQCVCTKAHETAPLSPYIGDITSHVPSTMTQSQICGKDFGSSVVKEVSRSMRTSQKMIQGHMHRGVNALFNTISAKLRKHQGEYEMEHEGTREGSEAMSESEENINLRLRPLWMRHYRIILTNLNMEVRDMRYKVLSLLYRRYKLT